VTSKLNKNSKVTMTSTPTKNAKLGSK